MIVGKLVERASTSAQHAAPYLATPIQPPTSTTPLRARSPQATRAKLPPRRPFLSPPARNSGRQARYEAPGNIFWDDDQYRGDAYPAYAWAVYVAEVAVDTRTYTAGHDFDALQEVGKVMHPVLAKGQIEGGVAQGIGYALYEKVVWQNGRMANNQMTNYIMPTQPTCRPSTLLRGDPLHPWPRRRQGHRRTAHGRPRTRDPQRHRTRHRHHLHSDPTAPRRHL